MTDDQTTRSPPMNRPLTEIVAEMRARAAEATPDFEPRKRYSEGLRGGQFWCLSYRGKWEGIDIHEDDDGEIGTAFFEATKPSNVIALADGFDERGREIERLGGERDDLDQVINDREGEIRRLTQERDEARAINSEYLATPVGQYIARATAAEARVKELEDALRPLTKNAGTTSFHPKEMCLVRLEDVKNAARLLSGGADA